MATVTSLDEAGTELDAVVALVRALADAPVSAEERAAASRCLIDSIGCALAGIGEPTARRTAAAFTAAGGDGLVTVLGSARRLPVRDALLVNAAAIRALDFNDVYSARNNHHPSESIIPIALALAEQEAWSGPRLIDAVAVGYRISLTVGELWSGLLGKGWAPAASLGQLSNAAFLGTLRGLDDEGLANAIAIAAVTAPALAVVFRGELSDARSLVSGLAVQAAWQAVQLAQAAVTGPADVLDGSAGYDELVGGSPELVSGPDAWTDARHVQQKAFPTVFTTHAAIEAAVQVAGALGDDRVATLADPATRVEILVPPKVASMAAAPARWHPTTRESAQFSLPYSVATALLEGACTVSALDQAIDGPAAARTTDLVARLTVTPDERWGGYAGGQVVVTGSAGQLGAAEVSQPRGSADNPLTEREIEAKFLELAATGRDPSFATRVLTELTGLGDASTLDAVLALLATDQLSGDPDPREPAP